MSDPERQENTEPRARKTLMIEPRFWIHDRWQRPLGCFGTTGQFPLPEPSTTRPVLVTIEYKRDPDRAQEFLEAIQKYQRIRRRDGATRWGVYYDSESLGIDVETFLVDSWAEHQRPHNRFTLADRAVEDHNSILLNHSPENRKDGKS